MQSNYFTIAFRLIYKNGIQSFITILSLSIGLASSMLIAVFVSYHLSFDKFQPDYESSYRLQQYWVKMGLHAPLVSSSFNNELSKVNGIRDIFCLIDISKSIDIFAETHGRNIRLEGLFASVGNIDQFLQLNTLAGDMGYALSTPYHLALSVTEAHRLFGHTNILGNTIQDKDTKWTVSAIFEDLPDNTHFYFKAITSASTEMLEKTGMGANNSYTYIKLISNKSKKTVREAISKKYNDLAYRGQGIVEIDLLRLDRIHLNSKTQFEMKVNGSQLTVLVCIGLSFLLIAISIINFVNMSISQSGNRKLEIGIRKAIGASRLQLILQFLVEYLLVSFISALAAIIIALALLPWFSSLTGNSLVVSFEHILLLFLLSLGAGITAGGYPALFFLSLGARDILGGKTQGIGSSTLTRKLLLTLQAALSVSLIVASITVFQQLKYLKDMPVGYDRSQRIEISGIPASMLFKNKNNILLPRLTQVEGVLNAGTIDTSLTNTTNTSTKLIWPGVSTDVPFLPFVGSGYGIVKAQGLTLLAGRDFSPKYGSDWYHEDQNLKKFASIIVTESIIRMAGIDSPESAIGKVWKFSSGQNEDNIFNVKIVGVISDIQVGSSKNDLSPLFFICGLSWLSKANIVLTINQKRVKETIELVKLELNQFIDSDGYTISFLEENYANLYRDDQRVADFILIFCGLTIFLTCMGILGLSSFSAQCRAKEFSIRKILGASKIDLINLLAREYLWLLVTGVIIAIPFTYYLLGRWLSEFNDHVSPSLLVYLGAAITVSLMTWSTIALTGLKYIRKSPASVLNIE